MLPELSCTQPLFRNLDTQTITKGESFKRTVSVRHFTEETEVSLAKWNL